MKAKIFATALFLISFVLSSTFATNTICGCRVENGVTLITYGYAVEGSGCCTGTVDEFWGGNQNNYQMGNEGVWVLTSSTAIDATSAQSTCCPKLD